MLFYKNWFIFRACFWVIPSTVCSAFHCPLILDTILHLHFYHNIIIKRTLEWLLKSFLYFVLSGYCNFFVMFSRCTDCYNEKPSIYYEGWFLISLPSLIKMLQAILCYLFDGDHLIGCSSPQFTFHLVSKNPLVSLRKATQVTLSWRENSSRH